MLNNRIQAASNGTLVGKNTGAHKFSASKTRVESSNFFSPPVSTMNFGAPGFSTMLQGFVPDTNEASLTPHYREIYYYDSVGGATVDMMSTFPFSDYTLVGLESADLAAFSESMSRMNMRSLFQSISNCYMVDGAFIGSLIFDSNTRSFQDMLVHDYMSSSFSTKPFHALDPVITVNSSYQLSNFLSSNSPYVDQLLGSYPRQLIDKYASGSVVLDPLTTVYIPRQGLRDRNSISYLKRILPVYLLEKTMYRGTLMETSRRQRSTSHIKVGGENWIPTDEEMGATLAEFQRTDLDPLGAWIITRQDVDVQDVRIAGEFFKWQDTFETFTPYKLRALGISEAFLSGDASYATAEAAVSVFMEHADAYRQNITYQLFTSKIFPILSVLHGLYRDPSKVKDSGTPEGLMQNISNQRNLKIPTVRWHKSLEGKDEASQWDILTKLDEQGIPVPLKMLLAAAEIDPTTLFSELSEDVDLRKKLKDVKDRIANAGAQVGEAEEDSDGDGDMRFSALPHTASSPLVRKRPLLSRTFSDKPIGVISKSGNSIHAVANETRHKKKMNEHLLQAMKSLKDPHHRQQVRNRVAAASKDMKVNFNL